MKAAGALCILIGAFLGQSFFQRERRRRQIFLSDLRLALFRAAEEIRTARTPFPLLLAELDCGAEAHRFFHGVSELLRRGEAPDQAWRAETLSLESSIGEEERRILESLGPDLRGDEERIRAALLDASEKLSERAEALERSSRDDTRRTAALLFSGAALLVILLY